MTLRMKLKVNSGLWVIMMCQGRFINCEKCTTVVWDVDSGEDWAGVKVGRGIYRNSLYFPLNFAVNPKLLERKLSLLI